MSLRRLEALGGRHLRYQPGRSALTAAGVVLGVAVLFGVQTAGAAVETGVAQLGSGGTSTVDVRAYGNATMPQSVADRIAERPGVEHSLAVLEVAASASSAARSQPGFGLYGLDRDPEPMGGSQLVRGRAPATGTDEVVVNEQAARALAVDVGDTLQLAVAVGSTSVTVVGVQREDREDPQAAGWTSLATAQRLAERPDAISRVDLALTSDAEAESFVAAATRELDGVGFEVVGSGGAFSEFVGLITSGLQTLAFLALFVGGFLIHLTLSVAVVERTPELGELRAVGVEPRQLRRLVLTEAALLGLLAGLVGLAVGALLAVGLVRLLALAFGIDAPAATFDLGRAAVALAMGVLVTIGAALLAARRAARLSPVVALRGEVEQQAQLSRGWVAGLVLIPAGLVLGRSL